MTWPMVKLGDIAVKKGGSVNPEKFPNETFMLWSIPAYDNGTPEILAGSAIGSSKKILKENDVLISRIIPHIRRVLVVGKEEQYRQIGSGEWIQYRSEIFHPHFLKHYLSSDMFHKQFMETVSGVGGSLLRARPSEVERIEVPCPPLEEQKRIAAILDKADAIRQKRQQAIALADDFLRSVFLDMFGDPVTNPLGWKTGSLIDFGNFKNGLNYTSSEAGEEVFCIGVGDFKSLDRIEGVSSLSKINLSSLPKNDYFVDEGDILFVRSNGNKKLVGRNVIVYPEGSKVTFSGFCIRYRINDKDSLSNLYLSHCLKIPSMRKLLLSGGQGANIQNISQKTLSELTIPIPSVDMQNTYNEIVNGHQRLIKKSNDDFLKSYELFNCISNKAFSGQL
ncbi:restriction endonuclease subunit S [Aeromonas enteropelogenes]|uniref:restriction endonuclease subunit S n=1 Tax=Aeromonas enteropelogenes TaxID=29489 RepID=UPI003BA2483D